MTTTDTRIAELLGWEVRRNRNTGRVALFVLEDGSSYQPECFTTDLNLTVREIERKGWDWNVGNTLGGHFAFVHGERKRKLDTPAEALALAFLAALEAEKEGK